MIQVTFVRHGETKTNAGGICQGHGPGELTAEGIEMTKKVGVRLKSERYTKVYSSDLQRCTDTTENILKFSEHKQPDVIFAEYLREREMGEMELKPWNLVMEMAKEQNCSPYECQIRGAESYQSVVKRAGEFFQMITEGGEENILVVCHGAWLKSLLWGYIFSPVNAENFQVVNFVEMYKLYKENIPPTTSNTCVTRLTVSPKDSNSKRTIHFHTLFDVTHLLK